MKFTCPASGAMDGNRVTNELMSSDESLMLEFQRGSREAFDELFARYREPLYGFFRRRLDNRERSEDLVQETFLAVIRATTRYQPRSLVRTYFYAIALKLVMAERRKSANRDEPLDSAAEPVTEAVSEDAVWVKRAVAQLEATEREILLLREYEQLSYGDIADLLRLPVNTVKSRLFRARIALRKQLDPAFRMNSETQSSQSKADKEA